MYLCNRSSCIYILFFFVICEQQNIITFDLCNLALSDDVVELAQLQEKEAEIIKNAQDALKNIALELQASYTTLLPQEEQWLYFMVSTSHPCIIQKKGYQYYIGSKNMPMHLFAIEEGDHNICFCNKRIWGYDIRGNLFYVDEYGKRVSVQRETCSRLFNI